MLQTKLFRGFVILVVLFALMSAGVGIRFMQRSMMEDARTRVSLDVESARSVFESQLREIETVMKLVSAKEALVRSAESGSWDDNALRVRLDRVRSGFDLDFMGVVSPDGQVVFRPAPPYAAGDSRISNDAIREALSGRIKTGVSIMSRAELKMEAVGLADRAFLQIEETPRARRTRTTEEDRGMVMISAVPIQKGMQLLGVVYGGILVNRNHGLIDEIQRVVYKDQTYNGAPMGTATIFLDDCRIATTVKKADGNRALGTLVSKEVADQVLDNARVWIGDAFVVKDWYLTVYEPIRDCGDKVVGMLYVGILKRPFQDYSRRIIARYVVVSVVGLCMALLLAFLIARRLAGPIHRLVEAANRTAGGERPAPVSTENACHETEVLIHAFNQMTKTLSEREEKLQQLNRSYMETLGFVSHELKSPLSSMLNYLYLLKEQKLGEITDKQRKAVGVIDNNVNRLVEMVRHYLSLSRIENDEFEPVRTMVDVTAEVIEPLVDSHHAAMTERKMVFESGVRPGTRLNADLNMTREVFENLMSNAIKYGRVGGTIGIVSAEARGFVEFRFRNDGEGIPKDKVGDLFQRFSRLNGAEVARSEKGSGLGLFITKRIIEAHGGGIRVESQPGEWAEFIFTLPAYDIGAGKTVEGGTNT